MASVLVSIVIVTWNKRADVLNLLDSLQSLVSDNVCIIVVDNASTDGTSVAIKLHPLKVTLLENKENLGGTGGFNTGIRHALEERNPKYIWLLDNDAEVTPDTLEKLMSVMEADSRIGVAGSCILDTIDRNLIVEAGGHVDDLTATWKPYLRYQIYSQFQSSPPLDVDYVPACSAMVRKELFDAIGIMDERYFLHWDDVDFCRVARKAGFRIVSVLDSVVYHGTEKGYSNAVLYFDVRNSLLFISKHLSPLKRIIPMFRVCLRSIMAAKMFGVVGEKQLSWYLCQAIDDFTAGRFGSAPKMHQQSIVESDLITDFSVHIGNTKKVLIFAVGTYSDIVSVACLIRSSIPNVDITLAAPADRLDAYRTVDTLDNFISYDLARGGLLGGISFVKKILQGNFDCAVSAGKGFIVPFAFFLRRHFVVSDEGKQFCESNVSLKTIWKLPFAAIRGVADFLPLFIKCWSSGKKLYNEFNSSGK